MTKKVYLPCILSKELLENAYHSSTRRKQQKEKAGYRTQDPNEGKPPRAVKGDPGEELCVGQGVSLDPEV